MNYGKHSLLIRQWKCPIEKQPSRPRFNTSTMQTISCTNYIRSNPWYRYIVVHTHFLIIIHVNRQKKRGVQYGPRNAQKHCPSGPKYADTRSATAPWPLPLSSFNRSVCPIVRRSKHLFLLPTVYSRESRLRSGPSHLAH